MHREVKAVLSRDYFTQRISKEDQKAFLNDVLQQSEIVQVKLPHPEFRDPKDRYLLAMLRDTNANLLVTGDKALLDLDRYMDKPIITPNYFMQSYLPKEDNPSDT